MLTPYLIHIPVTREILANPLLIVPEQPVKGQNIAIADERQAVIDGVTWWGVGSNVQEKPAPAERKSVSGGFRQNMVQ